jgi:hypothetical protein
MAEHSERCESPGRDRKQSKKGRYNRLGGAATIREKTPATRRNPEARDASDLQTRISQRAYPFYEDREYGPGSALEDWLRAEQEIPGERVVSDSESCSLGKLIRERGSRTETIATIFKLEHCPERRPQWPSPKMNATVVRIHCAARKSLSLLEAERQGETYRRGAVVEKICT